MAITRTVFFLSDRTGITAETLGHSLLTQFESVEFKHVNVPFIQSEEKAWRTVEMIDQAAQEDGQRPILFCTLVDERLTQILAQSQGLMLDFFGTFISPLEQELGLRSTHSVGRAHGIANIHKYYTRIDAMNFALDNDDGVSAKNYDQADVILIGVSRCGKTPTCIYLALQYGIFAANYPLVEEDLKRSALPEILQPHRAKLYGLSIDVDRLTQIRGERRPNSRYASFEQCLWEIQAAERLLKQEQVHWMNTTLKSIEEIATTILDETRVRRRFF